MAKRTTDKTSLIPTKKKTTIGCGKFSRLPNRKGSTKKKYRGQGR